MLMPVLRLIGIYVVVGLAIFGLFNRDKIGELFGFSGETTVIEQAQEPTSSPEETSRSEAASTAGMTEQTSGQHKALAVTAEATDSVDATDETGITNATQPENTGEIAISTAPVSVDRAGTSQNGSDQPPVQLSGLAGQLDNARRAFWNGDMNGAESIYRQLVVQYPNSADANGELGNILFSTRRFDEAGKYYFAVGEIAVHSGNTPQLMNMIGVLQGIAPNKAEQLRALAGARLGFRPVNSYN